MPKNFILKENVSWVFTINLSLKRHKYSTLTDSGFAFTILLWFRLFVVILQLPSKRTRGIIHEALDHVRPNQSQPTKRPMLHHKYGQRRVEVGLLRQLLMIDDRGRGDVT